MIKFINLQMFANPNTTTTADLTTEMKTFYKTQLLQNVRDEDYFMQLGDKQSLPKNAGKTIEFRKFKTFEPALTPLTEGVTPDGTKLSQTEIHTTINQFGDYSVISDRLELEAIDNNIAAATEEHGANAGVTLNLLTRNVVITGTNVMYAGGKERRSDLTADDKITAADVNKMATFLKKQKAPRYEGGKYLAVIHPSVAEDLRNDPAWVEVHKYSATTEIFNGEIGELHGIRFVEDVNQKIYKEEGGIATYAVTVMGKGAYKVIDPDAESLDIIVKQRGSGGTEDPLDQRSTVGWKASTAAIIAYNERLLRYECASSYSTVDDAN